MSIMIEDSKTEFAPHTAALFEKILRCLKPTENITLAEWADKYRRLPLEASAEPGRWQTSRTPYLRKIMECISDPNVREVVMMTCVQVGKSEILLNAMGYYTHIEPSPILIVQPTVDTGKKFSKERIAPTIRDTPVLRSIIGSDKSRDARNTVMQKLFPGGYIAIVGANSPAGLASRPIKILLADEIDRWPESAKKEGDPLTIVEKRTTTYPYNKKILKVSTPTIGGVSRIEHEYNQGTMEVWKLPCPGCGDYQELRWENIYFLRDKEGTLDLSRQDVLCECEACGDRFNEIKWKYGQGEWFPANPDSQIKSFHLSAFVSPWISWADIVEEFLSSKGDTEMMKVWTNTMLGEPFITESEVGA